MNVFDREFAEPEICRCGVWLHPLDGDLCNECAEHADKAPVYLVTDGGPELVCLMPIPEDAEIPW